MGVSYLAMLSLAFCPPLNVIPLSPTSVWSPSLNVWISWKEYFTMKSIMKTIVFDHSMHLSEGMIISVKNQSSHVKSSYMLEYNLLIIFKYVSSTGSFV